MNAAKKIFESLKELSGVRPITSPMYMGLVEIFPLKIISSKREHELALNILDKLISRLNETKISDDGADIYVAALAKLIGDYEKSHYKTLAVSGAEMLAYLMELQDLTQADLAKELGGQPVVSKILKGERELNLRQIKALSKRFKVSPELFI